MRSALLVLLSLAMLGCSGSSTPIDTSMPDAKGPRKRRAGGNDRSMCLSQVKDNNSEVIEAAGRGSEDPNIRRVFQFVGTGEDRHKVLVCREIDTNFDGVKDVVRRYNDAGESLHEEADANYDGRIDTWLTFAKGRLAEVRTDTNHDGNADQWKYYSEGRLARIKRDTNRDGRPDVWEIYRDGKLERMGVDIDGDERVDRWNHDTDLKRRAEEAEQKAIATKEAEAKRAAGEGEGEGEDSPAAGKESATPSPSPTKAPAPGAP